MLYTATVPLLPEMGQSSGPRGQFRDHVVNQEQESPECTHRHSQDLAKSSLGNELPEGHGFIMSTTQVNEERDCTC